MRKYLYFIVLFMAAMLRVQAQRIEISGKVTDPKGEAVAFANVALQRTDSTFAGGGASDEKGMFKLKDVQRGSYLLKVSFMGYRTQYLKLENIDRTIDLGEVQLQEDAVALEEVTVTGSNVTHQVDREIILPSERQIKASSSGYELLNHLQLPELKVNSIEQTVSTQSGGAVELRINGVKASAVQVQALRPSEVLRVEYIDNPGLRYAASGAEAVINYVLKKRVSGMAGSVGLTNAFTTGFGNDYVSLRANHKQSEFGLDYSISYRDYNDRYITSEQRFALPDGSKRERRLEGIPTRMNYQTHDIEAVYNLTKPEKSVFNALFRYQFSNYPHNDYAQRMQETGKADLYNLRLAEMKAKLPAIDLFYEQQLKNGQSLTFNVVGTYIRTDYMRDYQESLTERGAPVSTYNYGTTGNRYSVIGEGIYRKNLGNVVLSAGLNYLYAYTDNHYTGSVDQRTDMDNSKLYGYLQAQGKWAKLNYVLAVGMSRDKFKDSEHNGAGYTYFTFRPQISLSYPLFKGAYLRYTFSSAPGLPSLSALSDVRQQLTDLEFNRGNRDLKPYRSFTNRLQLSWGNRWLSTRLSGIYAHYNNPIMEQTTLVEENGNYFFEYASANQKRFDQLGGTLSATAKFLRDIFSLSLYGGVNRYQSRGHTYSHDYTGWYGGGSLSAEYKGFSFYASFSDRFRSLYGETISYGEQEASIELSYSRNQWQIAAAMMYPFISKGWNTESKNLNREMARREWTCIKDNANMFLLSLRWNFSSGRKHNAGAKTLNNADGDSGIAM